LFLFIVPGVPVLENGVSDPYLILITLLYITEVNLSEEHHATIAANQHLQHGPELEPIDPSYIGRHGSVTVEQTKANHKPFEKVE
jgi:hypothetical protein